MPLYYDPQVHNVGGAILSGIGGGLQLSQFKETRKKQQDIDTEATSEQTDESVNAIQEPSMETRGSEDVSSLPSSEDEKTAGNSAPAAPRKNERNSVRRHRRLYSAR